MEPVCFNTGNSAAKQIQEVLKDASMEPVCFNTGNRACHRSAVPRILPLQWSRCVSTPETEMTDWRCCEKKELQWSRCVSTPETVFQGDDFRVVTLASMEPVCFNTGNLQGLVCWSLDKELQWSRCVSTPETQDELLPSRVKLPLQWSRCVSTPETCRSD